MIRDWLAKYWTWLFIFTAGPLGLYLTALFHLQQAPVTPVLIFFLFILFLPPWEAGVGFIIATSLTTLQHLGIIQPSLYLSKEDVIVRLIVLSFLAALIIYVKKKLRDNFRKREQLIAEKAFAKAALEELTKSEQRMRSILGSQSTAVIVSDRDGNITYVNNSANRLFKYKDNEMLSLHISNLVPEELRDVHRDNRREYFDHPEDRVMDPHHEFTRGVRSDGTELKLHISLGWYEYMGEICVIATIEDVADKLELEKETIRANAAEETVRVRDRFLSLAAHELKTPIASIVLYSDLLEKYYIDTLNAVTNVMDTFSDRKELTDKAIKAIQRQALNISLLVNQFLDISLLRDVKSLSIHCEHISTCKLLREIVELSQLQTDKHKLILICEHEMDGYVDRLRMEQIMVNLLNNAIKYSPDGGDIIVTARELEGHSVSIDVRDYGLGIPEEARPKIFTRFFRAHPDIVPDGLGLGLYLSKEIMNAHAGSISFRTPEDGKGGTVFNITFPPEEVELKGDGIRL